MKKIILLGGCAMLLALPAFGQSADNDYNTTLSAQSVAGGYACNEQSCGVYGSGNIAFPNNPAAAAAAGAYSRFFLPAPNGTAAGAFAYQPEPVSRQECAQRFKSYDPRSGTYLGRDGYRHACP